MNAQRVQLDAIPLPDAPTDQAGIGFFFLFSQFLLYHFFYLCNFFSVEIYWLGFFRP